MIRMSAFIYLISNKNHFGWLRIHPPKTAFRINKDLRSVFPIRNGGATTKKIKNKYPKKLNDLELY